MTTNHCPERPARNLITRKTEIEVHDFAVKIQEQISAFASEYSMDNVTVIDSAILDSWTECPRCESAICETNGKAYGMIISQIMQLLESEF